jgi:hypothetical protein
LGEKEQTGRKMILGCLTALGHDLELSVVSLLATQTGRMTGHVKWTIYHALMLLPIVKDHYFKNIEF